VEQGSQESDEGFNLLTLPPAPRHEPVCDDYWLAVLACKTWIRCSVAGVSLRPAQQMIDQRIQGRQAEEQRLAQMEQMQAFRATLPPEQHQMFDMNPEGFMDQITSAEFRAPNYQVFGENIYRTDRGLERFSRGDEHAVRTQTRYLRDVAQAQVHHVT
jgi:hypothetical protein